MRCRDRGIDCLDTDPLLVPGGVLEPDLAGKGREHGVIPAQPGTGTGKERHAPLADDDRAGRDELAVADLHAQALADRVAPVLRAGAGFLVGHGVYSSFFVGAGFALGLAAGFASAAPLCVFARGVFGASALAVEALALVFAAGLAAAFAVVLAAGLLSALALVSLAVALGADALASFAARAASSAACLAAASSRRWRSVFAAASALRLSAAALLLPSLTSVIRRTISSWR